MRHFFISDLVKELLGPRNGATEQFPIDEEPRNEYSTGQLIPQISQMDRSPEEEEALGVEASDGDEDSNDQAASFINQAFIDAGQNFRRIPSSMGVSFVLSDEPTEGDFSVCVTWGRYESKQENSWVRNPNCWVIEYSKSFLTETQKSLDGSLGLTFKVTKVKNKEIKVTVYLTSLIGGKATRRPKTEEIIFQPEIRIVLRHPETLIELGDLSFTSHDSEWQISTRQYERFKVFARGHLCGAYWKEIDPQRPFDGPTKTLPDIPFKWIDGQHFLNSDERLKRFFLPDIRTDFVPMYPSPTTAPTLEVDLKADELSKCSNFDELNNKLGRLILEYENWIQKQNAASSNDEISKKIITRHIDALTRIKNGLTFLKNDKSAFYSFLFMNKAMAMQYSWGKSGPDSIMKWRLFQMAFILLTLESAVKRTNEREICDTIWFPTGGGKTEAYLGLAAFVLAYRRRISANDTDGSKSGEGTCVISRYTLRLLTIQQFRRALKMIMACEVLRCFDSNGNSKGWAPPGIDNKKGFIWGRSPFSIGLWVGAAVTPNSMKGQGYDLRGIPPGALKALEKPPQADESDPAQVIECPCCETRLSIPIDGIPSGISKLSFFVYGNPAMDDVAKRNASTDKIKVEKIFYKQHKSQQCGFLSLNLSLEAAATASNIEKWWTNVASPALGVSLASFTASRPGYIPIQSGRRGKPTGYEIRCPESTCELNSVIFSYKLPSRNREWELEETHPVFSNPNNSHETYGLRISAVTVDEQLYGYPPSMLISTVDKFARLAFTNEAASLLGRVRSFSKSDGFSQEVLTASSRTKIKVSSFMPPWLIIQDELHLLEGPLGSTFGLFETAIEALSDNPKYIASSATIRNSIEQVSCLMGRENKVFPPVNLDIENGFFLQSSETHPLDERHAGRLFLGVAFPGRAPQTPTLRIWGRLLQTAQDQKINFETNQDHESIKVLDHFWTLVGYFNAVRELAQGETLLRQDIPQYLDKLRKQNPNIVKRELTLSGNKNLSSQTGSSELPGILAKMERTLLQGDALNAVASTSMFGTGVDIARLSLMIVHGQPKSASQYIQAVGRIGRRKAGLAVVFFRVSKPRDLNHYEYFTGYHRKLPVAVEPITVKPLSPKALDRTTGALLAVLLRNWRDTNPDAPVGIDEDDKGALINSISPELQTRLLEIFKTKWERQTIERRPQKGEAFIDFVKSQIERWQHYAKRQTDNGLTLPYSSAGKTVVLGQYDSPSCVFPNAPQSLREVEPTINIYTENE